MNIFKRFTSYYKPYLKAFTLDMLCASTVSICDLAVPFLISYLIKSVFSMVDTTKMFETVFKICIVLLFIYIIRTIAQFYVNSYGHIMGAKMETDMRNDLFEHLEKLSFSYYDKNNTGVMMSRIVSDLFDVTELAHHGPEDLFISIFKLLGSFIILSSINKEVTLILIIIVILIFIFSYYSNKKMRNAFMDNRKKIGNVNSVVQDSLSGIRVVKSFSNEDIESEKFKKGNNKFLKSKKKTYLIMGMYFGVSSFLQGFMYISVFISSAYFIKNGTMSSADIVTYILYINMFLEPINKLVNFTEQFQKGFTGFQRMIEVLDTEPDIIDKKDSINLERAKGEIQFTDVSFNYDEETSVLSNINIYIPSGKTFALVGPSGSGKTTFCSIIPRFYDVSNGSIKIDGIDIRDITLKSLRKNIGVVQQDVYIFNNTIKENIAYGRPGATFEEIVLAAKNANIHDYIMSLEEGYDTFVGERGIRFSGGQKQRISIARVFLKNPPILILDEATSALDNESERYIQNSLNELSKNRTTIIIAHRLSTIKNADEIIVLTNDGIEEQGTHDILLDKNGMYSNLYNMQFE